MERIWAVIFSTDGKLEIKYHHGVYDIQLAHNLDKHFTIMNKTYEDLKDLQSLLNDVLKWQPAK
jgi:hypothetical protein